MAEEGVVKWFNRQRGFGFIRCLRGPDVFVHYSSIRGRAYRSLEAGERVRFEVVEGPRGLVAQDVARLGPEPDEGAPTTAE